MNETAVFPSRHGLDAHGLRPKGTVYWNLRPPLLVAHAIRRGEGELAASGALVATTGKYTGRSPGAKYIVRDASSAPHVDWGKVNQPITPEQYDKLERKLLGYLDQRDELFVQDLYAGASADHRLSVRVVSEFAWHSLFARQLFVRPQGDATADHQPDFTVLVGCGCLADPAEDGTSSEAFVVLNFSKKTIIIGGTQYAGEIKKSIFTVINYVMPLQKILSMHCSANMGDDGQTALFFGLSGTGKTTLSADPNRHLIGDDEHCWTPDGIFNVEGGCYAKMINLSAENEPQIYNAIRFGSVLENVILDPVTRAARYEDNSLTENTRGAYPLEFIDNSKMPSVGGHPSNVVFLTCDAFGVLPPVSRLTPEQAMYHFLSGYTAKVAGTERGLGNEPQATFSTCFGAPFLPLNPAAYADLLGQKLEQHHSQAWLLNTGWSGGAFGTGKRISLPHTRAIVTAVLNGSLKDVEYQTHPLFGLQMPRHCPGVPDKVLNPVESWADQAAYERQAKDLASRFQENFKRFTAASDKIKAAGPKL